MSTTIDERVVSMQFDNSKFEKNVATTMTTLDKLKEKLNLEGAAKGFENIDSAAKKVNLSGLSSAADTVAVKFSHMQMTIQHQLDRIVDSAVNAGKRIVKSLTIDPIKSGFSEYETKMGSIQTILANTEHQGTTLDDVTEALNKLNLYADKTIYNFQQMTKNIGTFTAAGVDLQTSVNSIQGIANLAAVSGSTSQQASTAMYQLSQALASGTVKLMDWNSVVNAGMGGKVFQNALIRTAAMLDGSAEDVESWQKKHIDAYGSFRESLSKEQWLTTEVLTTTLEQFTMAAETGSDEWNEFKRSLMETGYTEAQAEEILKMANTATDAATKVKTFTQLMDTLKESAQSGWAQTWELIVGDFEEAKAFFTELSNIFGGIIGKSADRRNAFLGDALGSNWDKLIIKITDAGFRAEDFKESIRTVVGDDKLDALIADFGSLEKAIKEGAITSDVLKEALNDLSDTSGPKDVVEGLKELEGIFRRGNVSEEVKKLQEALELAGHSVGEFGIDGSIGPDTEAAIKAFQEAHGLLVDGIAGPETLGALKKVTEEISETTDGVDGLIDSCDELIDAVTKDSGRELILESLMNIIKAIQRPIEAVGEALRDTFSITPDQLYSGLEKINKFTNKFKPKGILDSETWNDVIKGVDKLDIKFIDFQNSLEDVLTEHGVDVDGLIKKYGSLGKAFEDGAISFDFIKEALMKFEGISESLLAGGENVEKVRRTFAGLFAVIDMVATILAGPFKFAFKVVSEVLSRMGLSILDVTARIGDGLVNLRDNIDNIVGAITTFIVDNVAKWIEEFKETEFFKTVAKWFEDASDTISTAIDTITTKIENFQAKPFIQTLSSIGNFFKGLALDFANSKFGSGIIDGISGAFNTVRDFFSKIPKWEARDFANIFASFEGVNITSFPSAIATFASSIKNTALTKVKTFFKNISGISWDDFKGQAFDKFIDFWTKISDKVKEWAEKGKEFAESLKTFIFGAEPITIPAILDLANKILTFVVLIKALNLLSGVIKPFDNITSAIDNFTNALKWSAISSTFKSMALALAALTLCIVVLTQITDMNKAITAAKMLGQLIVVMGAVALLMGVASSKLGADWEVFSVALSMLAMIGALVLLVHAIKELDGMKLKDPAKTFGILTGALLALVVGMSAIAISGGSSFKSVAAILTMITALKMMLGVIEQYEQFDWTGKSKAIRKMGEMLILLSVALAITSIGAGGSTGLALTIVAMVLSLKLLLNAIKEFANVDDATMEKGIWRVIGLLVVMGALAVALSLSNKGSILEKGQRSVNSLTGLAVALLAIVAAVWVLGKMATENEAVFTRGMDAVMAVLRMFVVIVGLLALANNGASGLTIGKIITSIILVGALIALLAQILKDMSTGLDTKNVLGSAAALSIILLAMSGVMLAVKKLSTTMAWSGAGNVLIALGGLAAVIGALGFILTSMQKIPWQNALGSAAALSLLLGAMVIALKSLTHYQVYSGNIWHWIGAMGALSVLMGVLGFVLYNMNSLDADKSIRNAFALSELILAMSGALLILSTVPPVGKAIVGKLISLAALCAPLFVLGKILGSMNNVENAIENATALSILMATLSLCTLVLAGASMIAPTIVPGVLALVALCAMLGLLVSHLSTIDNTEAARENAKTLANLAIVLSLCTIPLAVAGLLAPTATTGVIALVALAAMLGLLVSHLSTITDINTARENAKTLSNLAIVLSLCTIPLALAAVIAPASIIGAGLLAALAVVLGLLVWGLSAIKDTETARTNVMTIILLLTSLTSMVLLIGSLGVDSLIAVAALDGIIGLVGKIGILAAAIGLLTKDGSHINDGLEILKMIAKGLGEVISAFGEGLTSGLPTIAENLSGFADKLGTFVTVMNDVDDGIVEKSKNLAEAIMSLTKGNFLNSLTSFGDGTLSSLGEELSKFADNSIDFIAAMDKMKPEAADNMETFADAVSTLNYVCGDNNITSGSLTKFSEGISEFAICIKDVSIVLSGITDEDVANIERSAVAGEALAELNKCIPASGGIWQKIAGEKDLTAWGAKISAFADSLIAYSNKITGNPIDSEAVKSSAEAGTSIADLNNAIPRDGGEWQKFAGSQDIAVWGTKIVSFAQALIDYSNTVTGNTFDKQAILDSAEAAGALAEVNDAIPKQDGWWQLAFGDQDMANFGKDLKSFADGLVEFGNAALEITQDKIDAIKNTGKAIDEIQLVVDKLDKTGGTSSWFGERDPGSFGNGIRALANGVKQCINVSENIDDITSISKLGDAVTAINDVVELIGAEWVNALTLGYIECFESMAIGLKDACDTMKIISNTGYNFSNLESLKLEMENISSVFTDTDVSSILNDWTAISDIAVEIVETANSLASINTTTYGGIDTLKGALDSLTEANVDGVIETFSGKAVSISSAVDHVVTALSTGLAGGATSVSTEVANLMTVALDAIDEKKENFRTMGRNLVAKLIEGYESYHKNTATAGQALGIKTADGVRLQYMNMYGAGINLGQGLVLGINSKQYSVYWAGYALGQKAVQGEKDGQQSNSPSKATIQAGKWVGEGLVIGMERMGTSVYNAGREMGKNAVGSISKSIRAISDTISTDIDTQPTIRPVLDLSDVRSGVNAIGGLLGAGAPIGVQANINSISSMMNSRSQNGINDDVVSAINKLRKDLGNVGNTTYSISGVTYDDGSNIAEAVKTITRAAVRERRI